MGPVNSMKRPSDSSSLALELHGITKSYGSVRVLHGVDLCVRSGSIHALLGANGAGKSTLLKVAVGATQATSGKVIVNGQEHAFSSTTEARRVGIGMVFQERSLIPDLSTVDNIFLNGEIRWGGLVNLRAELRECGRIFGRLGVHIAPTMPVGRLSIADQQMVEIAKALRLASAVLILDEPTAALTEREVQRLFTVIRQIAKSGVGIVYVSHRLPEVFALCDELTVIRDGRVHLSSRVADTSLQEVVEAIAGGGVRGDQAPVGANVRETAAQRPVIEIQGLGVGTKLKDISFAVHPGEIIGVAGLAGSGRSTLLKALFGAVARSSGEIRINGQRVNPTTPKRAISRGLYLIPEDRKTQGLVLSHSVEANLVISILKRVSTGPFIKTRHSLQVARQSIAQLRIRPNDPKRLVEWLSGGNQQKVVLGKALNAGGKVLLLDEPTFGVDVHSRAEIKARVRDFANQGNGVIWVTSDTQELSEVADRIAILADAKIREIVSNQPYRLAESEITHLIQSSDRAAVGA